MGLGSPLPLVQRLKRLQQGIRALLIPMVGVALVILVKVEIKLIYAATIVLNLATLPTSAIISLMAPCKLAFCGSL